MSWMRSRACGCFFVSLIAVAEATAQTSINSSPSTVVAKQGGQIVTLADVDAFAQGMPDKDRAAFFDNPQRLEALIGGMLLKKQLAAEARQKGLENDPSVKAQVDLAVEDALSKARMRRFRDELKVPDLAGLAKEDYMAHKENYVIHGKLDVKHVLISTKTRSDSDAKAQAEKVRAEAIANPGRFDELIEKYSEDPSKSSNHGLITDVGNDRYMPAFSSAAKALKKTGEISPVVKTKFGYHVIQLVERTPDKQQSFDEVHDQIVEKLRAEFIEKQVTDHTDGLRNQPIDANPDLVASLRTRYSSPTTPAVPVPAPQAAASGVDVGH